MFTMQISGKHWFFDILFRHPGDKIVNLKNVLAEETRWHIEHAYSRTARE